MLGSLNPLILGKADATQARGQRRKKKGSTPAVAPWKPCDRLCGKLASGGSQTGSRPRRRSAQERSQFSRAGVGSGDQVYGGGCPPVSAIRPSKDSPKSFRKLFANAIVILLGLTAWINRPASTLSKVSQCPLFHPSYALLITGSRSSSWPRQLDRR